MSETFCGEQSGTAPYGNELRIGREDTARDYLTGFEIAVKEGKAKSIMTSYNEINGTYANENKHLLQEILRKEWGFDGIVITDWGASNDHAAGVAAGSNLEMPAPGLDSAREILQAIKEKTLTEEELDACVDGLLDAVLTLSENAKGKKRTFRKRRTMILQDGQRKKARCF